MGLTIHYKLKFKGSEAEAFSKLREARSAAIKLGFPEISEIWPLNFSKDYNNRAENEKVSGKEHSGSYRWAKIQYAPKNIQEGNTYRPPKDYTTFKGFVFIAWAGIECEPTNIGLISNDGENWAGEAFTKTQYAEDFVKCHLLVITMLDALNLISILEEVNDEGEYWETRDISKLGENINASTKMISEFAGKLKSIYPADQISSAIDKSKNIVNVKKEGDDIGSKERGI